MPYVAEVVNRSLKADCTDFTDKPCIYTGNGGSGTDRIYLVPNGSTYEGDPVWNCTVPVLNRSRVNRVDQYHSGSDPKQI